jgi:hypothetical protein
MEFVAGVTVGVDVEVGVGVGAGVGLSAATTAKLTVMDAPLVPVSAEKTKTESSDLKIT